MRRTSPPALPEAAERFLQSVLELSPAVAAFDCDGTLWPNDSGDDFMHWEIRRGLIPADRAQALLSFDAEYKAGRHTEEECCAIMTTIHHGLPEAELEQAAREFFAECVTPAIFPEMRELLERLARVGCQVWAVSSTNEWVVRQGARALGIAAERVLATSVHLEGGCATERINLLPSGPGKASALARFCPQPVDAAFGNSVHDLQMLEAARHPFAVNPTAELERTAQERGWRIYFPSPRAS